MTTSVNLLGTAILKNNGVMVHSQNHIVSCMGNMMFVSLRLRTIHTFIRNIDLDLKIETRYI